MDARVPTTIAVHLAKAELKVAELERLEQSTPNLRSNSNQRIVIARKLKAARELAQSWLVVVSLVGQSEDAAEEEQAALDKEFKAAPERVVAQSLYRVDAPNILYCNRRLCYSMARKDEPLVPLASDDLPDGGICSHCGTDVLA